MNFAVLIFSVYNKFGHTGQFYLEDMTWNAYMQESDTGLKKDHTETVFQTLSSDLR